MTTAPTFVTNEVTVRYPMLANPAEVEALCRFAELALKMADLAPAIDDVQDWRQAAGTVAQHVAAVVLERPTP